MKLIIQPDDGLTPLAEGRPAAKKSIDLVIFRFDRVELEKALAAAVARGVVVRALDRAHQRRRREAAAQARAAAARGRRHRARTADDLPRYHGKMTIIDDTLFVLGFNYTKQDIEHSRSFGVVTRDAKLVKEARALFEADSPGSPTRPATTGSSSARRTRASSCEAHRRAPEAAADLRRASVRTSSCSGCCGAGRGGRRDPRHRQDRRRALKGVERAQAARPAAARAGDRPRRHQRVRRQPEPAQARARRAARDRLIVNDSAIARKMGAVFEADWAVGTRRRRTPRARTQRTRRPEATDVTAAVRRVMTPESTTCAGPRDRVERQLVLEDLGRHERQVGVEALGGESACRGRCCRAAACRPSPTTK